MVTLKVLKPYYIKTEENFVRIILAYQYFSVSMNNKVYQFIPVESNEIRVNRKTKKIENVDAIFAFQNGKEIIHVPMVKLIALPEFLVQIQEIAEPYYFSTQVHSNDDEKEELNTFMMKLERENAQRLIDKALDERDEEAFHELVKALHAIDQKD